MQSHPRSNRLKRKKSKWETQWEKIGKKLPGLYRYRKTGMYYARIKTSGKIYRESLKTKDFEFAKRKLKAFKERLDMTDPRLGKVTLVRWLEEIYAPTLRGAAGAIKAKQRIIARIKAKWFFAARQPMRELKQSQVVTFLNEQFGDWSESYWNSALSLIRDALEKAVDDHVIMENPAARLTYRRRRKPIRLTPSFEQLKAIVADIRSQKFNGHEAAHSADFIEFLGLAGLGQAEASGIKREHVDLESSRIQVFRHKTSVAFTIPIFPQVRALIEKLCEGKKAGEFLFGIVQARAALTNACKRLGYANYTQRSLRRLFVTTALERGANVKVIAEWQGHRDGGQLILQTYSHITAGHSQRQAALMTTETPSNVIELPTTEQGA